MLTFLSKTWLTINALIELMSVSKELSINEALANMC